MTGHFYTFEPLVMSKNLYDSLPADIQQAIVEAAIEAAAYERQLSQDFDKECLEKIAELGMEISEVDKAAFQKAVEPVYDKYKDKFGEVIEKIKAMDPSL